MYVQVLNFGVAAVKAPCNETKQCILEFINYIIFPSTLLHKVIDGLLIST